MNHHIPHADEDCTICGGTGWVDGKMCTGTAHSMRAIPAKATR